MNILPRIKLLLIVIAISLSGSFHFGYLLVIPNSASDTFKTFLNVTFFDHHGVYLYDSHYDYLWPLFLNLLVIGGFIGSLVLKPLAERFGRKNCFYVVVVLQAIGCFSSAVAYFIGTWILLSLGRLVSGIAIGISLGLQPMYFSEISPKPVIGLLNGMTGATLEFGLVFGSVIAMPNILGADNQWHWLFWIELSTTFCTVAVLPFLPESPKYLLASKNDYNLAKKSLIFFYHENVDEDLNEIQEEIKSESETVGLSTMFRKPHLRLGLLLGSLTIATCQCSGIGAISLYSTELFKKAGIPEGTAPYATVAVTFNAFLAALISSFAVDRVGRRPLIIFTLLILAWFNVLYVIFSFIGQKEVGAQWPAYICVAVTFLFTFIFGMGPATVMWFITAELMPQNARSTAMSFVQALQWVVGCISNTFFYPLYKAVEAWSWFMYIIPLVATSAFLYFKLPETKNKTTLDIIKLLGYSDSGYSSPTEDKLLNPKLT